MHITIHRGTHEIGGSCVEAAAGNTRIIVDLGMPLVQPWNKKEKLDSLAYARMPAEELLRLGVLPPVEGLYGPGASRIDAVLLSHPHQDHYGLIRHIAPGIPVYLSEGARRIIEVSDIFLPLKARIREPRVVRHLEPFELDDFRITPHLMDHSAYGAFSFLIEAGGKSVFYTGDFRGHGRKAAIFERLLRRPPGRVDWLLMEGTTLGGTKHGCLSEREIEGRIVAAAGRHGGLKLVYASGQNIDRLVSFYRAAVRTGRSFVVDLYTACVLEALDSPRTPRPGGSFRALRVLYTKPLMKRLLQAGRGELIRRFRPSEIRLAEIAKNPGRYFIMYRDSLREEFERLGSLCGGVLLYSQFEGYRKEPSFARTQEFLDRHGIAVESVHTSGHASPTDLRRLVEAIRPKRLVPIHSFAPERYSEMWPRVRALADGECNEVS